MGQNGRVVTLKEFFNVEFKTYHRKCIPSLINFFFRVLHTQFNSIVIILCREHTQQKKCVTHSHSCTNKVDFNDPH